MKYIIKEANKKMKNEYRRTEIKTFLCSFSNKYNNWYPRNYEIRREFYITKHVIANSTIIR